MSMNMITNDRSELMGGDYNPDDVYESLQEEQNNNELSEMMDLIKKEENKSFADKMLDKSDKFKMFSSIFSDLKDPLIMLFLSYAFLSKPVRKMYRSKFPYFHNEETGDITYTGQFVRIGIIIFVFYVVRRMLDSYFNK